MATKLTLKLDADVIERAKEYAERRGVSLSRLVETYFDRLAPAKTEPLKLTGVVAELAGALAGGEADDDREGYTEYLVRKYS